MRVRVLPADDNPTVREVVQGLLESTVEIVGSVADGKSLIEAAMRLKPDLIITDISMPVLNGIKAVIRLKELGCRAKVVFLTVHADHDFVSACLNTGASGYVLKSRMVTDLVPAIREVLADRVFVSPIARQNN